MMRVLILTPTALPTVTGNAMTAERWRRYLVAKGLSVRVMAVEGLEAAALTQAVVRFAPDVIHAHHAYRAGLLLLEPGTQHIDREVPLVISPGGTDIHLDLEVKEKRDVVSAICGRARVIVAQSEEIEARLGEILSHLRDRVVRIPKSFAWLGDDAFDLRAKTGCRAGELLFFLPAGIRPVKANLECLLALERVRAVRPRIRCVFAGPALDVDYAARFTKEIERLRGFARWLPPIPPQAMRAAYRGTDIVLNASFSEGLSNAMLEAAAAGKPVLASDIPGNRWPVLGANGDSPSGCLFDPHDPQDFLHKALKLIDDAGLRSQLSESGRRRAARWPGPEEEAEALIRVYEVAAGSV